MPKGEIFFTDKAAEFSSGWLPLTLIKESNKEGKVWRVMIIRAGWSKNGVFYSPAVLKASRKLFESAKVNAFQFKDHYFDHLPEEAGDMVRQGFAKNLAGWLESVQYEKVGAEEGLTGDFHVTDNFIRETFRNSWEDGKRDLLGFSIDAKGSLVPGTAEGKTGKIAQEIKHVNSVDIVTLPAAGGRLLRMVASMGGNPMDIKKLIEMVRDNPEILGLEEGVDVKDKSDEEVLNLLFEALNAKKKKKGEEEETEEAKNKKKEEEEKMKKAQEAEGEEGKKTGHDVKEVDIDGKVLEQFASLLSEKKIDEASNLLNGILEKYRDKYKDKYKKPEGAQASEEGASGDEKQAKSEEVEKAMNQVTEALKKLDVRESKMILDQVLSAEKALPNAYKERIRKQFEGEVATEDEIKESVKAEKELLAEVIGGGEVTGMGMEHITTGLTPDDRLQIAFHKLMGVEPTEKEKADWEKVPEFAGIREAYQRYTGDKEVRGEINQRMREAVSSDFPNALGTSMERRLLKEYSRIPINAAWRKFAVIDKPTNYKQQDLIRIGGLADLPVVAEDGEYTEFVSPSEEQANYTVTKKGKIFKVTRELIKNDDLRMLRKIPVKMGQAAARTLAKFVFDLVINYGSGAINGGTVTYDSKALYHADHNNVAYDALDFDSLDTGITAIANQLEPDSNETLGIQAKFLIVPYELRSLAKVLIDSENRPVQTAAGVKTGTEMSVNPNYKAVEPIIIPNGYLRSDQNNWYLIGDPADLEGIVIGFLDGRETPEILLQDAPGVDQVFTHDRIKYKIRHEYNGCIADHRMFYSGLVAGIS
jgi:hypothetical protein